MRGLSKIFLIWAMTATCASAQPPPMPEQPDANIGYRTVAEAKKSLSARRDITARIDNGWAIYIDEKALTIWSFAPPGDPAYPALAKRQAVQVGEHSNIETNILCEASKNACDDFVRRFVNLNNRTFGN